MIYAASDLHGNLVDPPFDATAILLGGDICPDFLRQSFSGGSGTFLSIDQGEHRQAHWLDTEFRLWLDTLSLPTVAIWGNHDFVGEHRELVPDLPWTLLEDSGILLDDEGGDQLINVWGTPWVPGLPRWAFYASDNALGARGEAIPEGLDVLLTHGPPYLAGDYIPTSPKQRNKYGNYGGDNVGDHHLHQAIRRARPKVTICGHIHEAHGRHWLAGNRVLNVASVTETYEVRDDFWTRVAF